MSNKSSALSGWTPAQIALGKRWVETWKVAGEELERIHRKGAPEILDQLDRRRREFER